MAKWNLLHLIGSEASPGLIAQLGGQYRVLPDELASQKVAAGESKTAKLLEQEILHPVLRLGRQYRVNLTASRTLSKMMRLSLPDLVVCWDADAIEQVRAASLGSRKHLPVVAMVFYQDDRYLARLAMASESMELTIVCGSDRLAAWAKAKLPKCRSVHRVYPIAEKSGQVSDRSVLRQAMGLDPQIVPIFVPIEGKLDDVFKSVVTCGIVERVEPKLRIILSGFDRNRLDRCYHFAQKTIVNPILHIVEGWDVRSVVGACDYMVQVRSDYADSLHVVDAWSRGVPVITNAFAEPAELLAADENFYDAGKPMSRRFACGLYKLMTDSKLREKIIENARKTAIENCSESVYRAQVVRLYQQLTQ